MEKKCRLPYERAWKTVLETGVKSEFTFCFRSPIEKLTVRIRQKSFVAQNRRKDKKSSEEFLRFKVKGMYNIASLRISSATTTKQSEKEFKRQQVPGYLLDRIWTGREDLNSQRSILEDMLTYSSYGIRIWLQRSKNPATFVMKRRTYYLKSM